MLDGYYNLHSSGVHASNTVKTATAYWRLDFTQILHNILTLFNPTDSRVHLLDACGLPPNRA
jgi:hypothetical protein